MSDAGQPANTAYDFEMALFAVPDGGTPVDARSFDEPAVHGGWFEPRRDAGCGSASSMVVDSGNVGAWPSVAMVFGKPQIAYYDAANQR